ncbi:MAG: integrin alpha, partial [Holophagales bacterium]|nr:integrin alpha [Holophagales bacterium]
MPTSKPDLYRQKTARTALVIAAGIVSSLAAAEASFGQLTADGNRWLSAMQLGLSTHSGAGLGRALTTGDFNGDGVDDLALGAPFQNIGLAKKAGQVVVVYSPADTGTPIAQVFHRDSPGVSGDAQDGNQFGSALASGDFDGDGFDDLAISAVENIGSTVKTGRVHVLYGSANGIGTGSEQTLAADLASGIRISRDGFGSALASGDFDGDGFD